VRGEGSLPDEPLEPRGAATALPPLAQFALQTDDLPPGFALTAPGRLGAADLAAFASYQEEFQQKNVTSSLGLQQTLIIITLLAQYTDPSSAHINVQNVSGQNLNQLFLGGSLNGFSSEAATVLPIEDDSSALHFSGDTNGTSIGEQSPAPNSGSTEESVDFTGLPASLTVYGTSGSFQSSQQARHWLARTHPRGAWTACISWTAVRARCRIG